MNFINYSDDVNIKDKTKYIIYITFNGFNAKWYIGKHITKNLNDDYLGSGTLFKKAVKKYGKEAFVKFILYIFDTEEEMIQKENDLISKIVFFKDCYNLSNSNCGYQPRNFGDENPSKRPEVKKKNSEWHKKYSMFVLDNPRKGIDCKKEKNWFYKKNHNEISKNKMKRKYFIFDSNKNEFYFIVGLEEFCKKNKLNLCAFTTKIKNKEEYKGFYAIKVKSVEEDETECKKIISNIITNFKSKITISDKCFGYLLISNNNKKYLFIGNSFKEFCEKNNLSYHILMKNREKSVPEINRLSDKSRYEGSSRQNTIGWKVEIINEKERYEKLQKELKFEEDN